MVLGCASSPPFPHLHLLTNPRAGHRPPIQRNLAPNDLEKYHAWTDGWCLVALALFLLSTNGAVASSAPAATPTAKTNAWYAKAAVAITLLHHVTTGYGAYQHYRLETHYNTAMGIGVWGNVWLTLVGVVTLVGLLTGQGNREVGRELKTK